MVRVAGAFSCLAQDPEAGPGRQRWEFGNLAGIGWLTANQKWVFWVVESLVVY